MHTSVTNPNPKLKTVAIVPFFNLSQEPDVDGRRFALAYFAELQKVPGFQVLPVGVAEVAMVEHQLQMNNPDDVLKLAKILNVDAVVIGAITDYSPYYPPRIGMQVSWYSPHAQEFIPGVPLMVEERHNQKNALNELFSMNRLIAKSTKKAEHQLNREVKHASHAERKANKRGQKLRRGLWENDCSEGCQTENPEPAPAAEAIIRGQSSDAVNPLTDNKNQTGVPQAYAQANQGAQTINQSSQTPTNLKHPITTKTNQIPSSKTPPLMNSDLLSEQNSPSHAKLFDEYCPPNSFTKTEVFDPRQPFMSYTRLFDGSDAALVAHLRDYLEISGDRRSGGWEAYLHRSEDFIRFTSHLMILEMLTLHGGQAKHQIIFKVRKYR